MLLYNVLYNMLYMLNAYVIFVLYYQYIEAIEFGTYTESIIKEGIKLLSLSIKEYYVLCEHHTHQLSYGCMHVDNI